MQSKTHICPQCHTSLPADAPEGICPECLMLAGLNFPDGATISMSDGNPDGKTVESLSKGDLFGEYRVVQELGRGAMGAVYEVEHETTGRRLALKLLSCQLDSLPARARFFREGRLAASINHPNSVYVYGTGEVGDIPVIAMELVDGQTLQERVKADGPLAVGDAVDAILDVIAALEAAQEKGILHRDIKPANCFQDSLGEVKIGDFGLSISTDPDSDQQLTREGVFLGTPAFCSPEQLRGDALNVRSDIYAVGVTLYYLLTGKTPFSGDTTLKLFANILEKQPESLASVRKDVPAQLAQAVMRCLEKTAGDRFDSYAGLREALAPFSSAAPKPAPLRLRVTAGVLDMFILSACNTAVSFYVLFFREGVALDEWLGKEFEGGAGLDGGLLLLMGLVYYTVLEGRWGCSLGKRICGLRVVDRARAFPGYLKAFSRTFIFHLLPMLPWLAVAGMLMSDVDRYSSGWILWGVQAVGFACWLLLFVTIRKTNGWTALHGLATGTRVIRRFTKVERSINPIDQKAVVYGADDRKIGPYHVLESFPPDKEGEWALAYDTCLLRKVWIRVCGSEAVAYPPSLRSVRRPGRVHWIGGKHSDEEQWDVFEAPTGQPLLNVIEHAQPWSSARFWLCDLAEELARSKEQGNLPEVLALDRVWIDEQGRAKILDFPAPGSRGEGAASESIPVEAFLGRVARAVLGSGEVSPERLGGDLPVHARLFIENEAVMAEPADAHRRLAKLCQRPAAIKRWHRAVIPGLCMGIVGCVVLLMMVVGQFTDQVLSELQSEPGEPFTLLTLLEAKQSFESMGLITNNIDRAFGVYVSSEYGPMLEDTNQWRDSFAYSLFDKDQLAAIEGYVRNFPDPNESEVREAREELSVLLDVLTDVDVMPEGDEGGLFSSVYVLLLFILQALAFAVAIPTILAAAVVGFGFIQYVLGIRVVKADGSSASRWRLVARSLVAWAPLLILALLGYGFPLSGWTTPVISSTGVLVGLHGFALLAIISMLLPKRGLADRIAGTRLVAR